MSEDKNSTGIVLDWEKQAQRGDPMPDGLEYPDQVLYQALSLLYARYRIKAITREQAQTEKLKLLDEYKLYQFRDSMEKEWVQIIKDTELARAEFRKNPSIENGWKLIEIIEGRKKNENRT